MKKRVIQFLAIMMILMLCFVGCGSSDDSEDTADDTKTETTDDTEGTEGESEDVETDTDEEEAVEEDPQPLMISIVVPSADGTAFEDLEVEVTEITPQNLINALIEQGILLDGIEVISMDITEQDGETCLDLDLNKAFHENITQQGTTGEHYLLGSISNTFLNIYHASKIKISVEGETLETGHNIYDYYMGYYTD
ncbi:MAG: GerMN domain-containing protein [Suipraeoptans sp.]